ncbi:MAG: bifunctional diaminohydroxyphosphoribosylaminopyrimidine deaminase/5-amino-6-(5-phosphoribosylamino)uracil reductase RibD [Nitrospira sp.]|nr:bifunctional diaminohydroxyphosphoribosylaminopyrimidine deaminase/5-amino-6-(5-phosphoribosylamino)uracil reductase RibD [Nitrospira sp.]
MALALRLAAKGQGQTSPNPMVGAVVVRGGRIVGTGYHRRAGEPHAEVLALKAAGSRSQGATLYVTLEPCCHDRKRTPPCVPALIASDLRRVVVAMRDPNPKVSGKGIGLLRRAGLDVTVDCLRDEAERLNAIYCHWRRTGYPFVVLKAAMTLDGKIATAGGASQWITGREARRHAHRLRSQMDAILVGANTVLQDDPRLTVRLAGPTQRRQPLRVILDSRLRIPLTARVFSPRTRSGADMGTLVATTPLVPKSRRQRLTQKGVSVLVLPSLNKQVSLRACLRRLAQQDISSVLIEGGSRVNASALQSGLVNRLVLYVAPLLLGGQDAKSVIGGESPAHLTQAIPLSNWHVRRIGRDLLIEATLLQKQ